MKHSMNSWIMEFWPWTRIVNQKIKSKYKIQAFKKIIKKYLQSHLYKCCNIASANIFPDETASARHLWINCLRTRNADEQDVASSNPNCSLGRCDPEVKSWSNPNKVPPSISFIWLLFNRAFTARWWICINYKYKLQHLSFGNLNYGWKTGNCIPLAQLWLSDKHQGKSEQVE